MTQINDDEIYGGRSPAAVGARLKLMRETLGYTQAKFASLIGLRQNTYAQLESGRNYPSVDVLWRISDYLSAEMVDMNWLLGGDASGLKTRFSQALKSIYETRQRIIDHAE